MKASLLNWHIMIHNSEGWKNAGKPLSYSRVQSLLITDMYEESIINSFSYIN